jgi:hypothetical protein
MIAYNRKNLQNLLLLDEAKNWADNGIITEEQFGIIQKEHYSPLFHPTFWLRILLFIATVGSVNAAVAYFAVLVKIDGENGIRFVAGITGIAVLLAMEFVFIREKNHYKSGVTEGMLYTGVMALYFAILGFDASIYAYTVLAIIIGAFSAVRYLNLIGTVVAMGGLAFLLFQFCSDMGGIFQAFTPFIFMGVFATLYFASQKVRQRVSEFYEDVFVIVDGISLLLVYAGGNYFVVRELNSMLGSKVSEGQDIPLAFVFYFLTVAIPAIYLYFGIKLRSRLLLRVGMLVLALSALTFKYYFSLGHPETTLTISGALILGLAIFLMNYLKVIRNGFTRDQLLSVKWDVLNAESIAVSATMGGNAPHEKTESFGGGQFGGGGAGSSF